MFKKIIFIAILFMVGGWYFYSKAFVYDANNPNSLDILLRATHPENKVRFIKDFELASNDMRATNLHGLSKNEISKIANNRRIGHINFLKKCLSEMKKSGKSTIYLDKFAVRKPTNYDRSYSYTTEDIQKIINKRVKELQSY